MVRNKLNSRNVVAITICLVGHLAGFWEFASRPSLCETPPSRQASGWSSTMRGRSAFLTE